MKRNVEKYGVLDRVRFIRGWYADSLKDFPHELALLWMDVDLKQSVIDSLQNVYPKLNPNAVIFSDGFTKGVDFEGDKIRDGGGEPAGYHSFFSERGIRHKAVHTRTGGLALIVPGCRDNERILLRPETFPYLIDLSRGRPRPWPDDSSATSSADPRAGAHAVRTC